MPWQFASIIYFLTRWAFAHSYCFDYCVIKVIFFQAVGLSAGGSLVKKGWESFEGGSFLSLLRKITVN